MAIASHGNDYMDRVLGLPCANKLIHTSLLAHLLLQSESLRFHPVLNILDDIDELDQTYRAMPSVSGEIVRATDEEGDVDDSPSAAFMKCVSLLAEMSQGTYLEAESEGGEDGGVDADDCALLLEMDRAYGFLSRMRQVAQAGQDGEITSVGEAKGDEPSPLDSAEWTYAMLLLEDALGDRWERNASQRDVQERGGAERTNRVHV